MGGPVASPGSLPGGVPTTKDLQASAIAAAATAVAAGSDASSDGAGSLAGRQRLVLADLPGLVPGAHAGKGRGTAFLAHLQRARCLALVVDMTGGRKKQQQQHDDAAVKHGQTQQQQQAGDATAVDDWGVLVPYTPCEQLMVLQVNDLEPFIDKG